MISQRNELAMAAERCEARFQATMADIARTSSQLGFLDARIAERLKRLGGTHQPIAFAHSHHVTTEADIASDGPVFLTPVSVFGHCINAI
jgi:hypothetical protein